MLGPEWAGRSHGLSQQLLLAEQPCLGQSTGTAVRLSGSESPRPTYQGVTSGFKAQGLSVLISKMGGVLIPPSQLHDDEMY